MPLQGDELPWFDDYASNEEPDTQIDEYDLTPKVKNSVRVPANCQGHVWPSSSWHANQKVTQGTP